MNLFRKWAQARKEAARIRRLNVILSDMIDATMRVTLARIIEKSAHNPQAEQ